MHQMSGAELTINLLERQGITIIAGIPGGSNLPLYDALSKSRKIRHVLTRHEQGAGFIAQGMARATGKPATCFATSGPGATNLLTAIADAKLDSIPIICITGQVPGPMIGTDAFQEVDIYGMSIPITKHNFLVRSAEDLLTVIPEAFRIATSGRPGPVLIDIPKDVQIQSIIFEAFPEPASADPAPAPDPTALQEAAAMINAAKRPILYAGGGIIASNAACALRGLAEKAAIPTALTLMGLGAVPADHSLCIGMLGMHAAGFTNSAIEECDLLITVGARFDDRATGKVEAFCPDARIIHIDIDPGELHKLKNAHLGITADAGAALRDLLPLVDARNRTAWLARIAALKKIHPMVMPGIDNPRRPYGIISKVAELAGLEAIIATDVGKHQMWTAQAYPFQQPRQLLSSGGLGTMGFGLPAAIGAALACPDRKLICFSGDGSLQMNIQELATAVEQNVNMTIILFNNKGLGLVRQQQDLFYGRRFFASGYRTSVDFISVAKSFGFKTFDLADSDDPVATLAAAISENGPCLVHAPIGAHEGVFPMVAPGAVNRDMILGDMDTESVL
jgi:acetolactate synthase-1/2/3 large subunit